MTMPIPTPDLWAFVFNTPIESGLRTSFLLLEAYPEPCDLNRLVQYDYLVVHSGDVTSGPESIHPPTPHRSGELLVRRSLVEAGIELMVRKNVIEKKFTSDGISYMAGSYAVLFLTSLGSEYSKKLRDRARWVIQAFQELSDIELAGFMQSRWAFSEPNSTRHAELDEFSQ